MSQSQRRSRWKLSLRFVDGKSKIAVPYRCKLRSCGIITHWNGPRGYFTCGRASRAPRAARAARHMALVVAGSASVVVGLASVAAVASSVTAAARSVATTSASIVAVAPSATAAASSVVAVAPSIVAGRAPVAPDRDHSAGCGALSARDRRATNTPVIRARELTLYDLGDPDGDATWGTRTGTQLDLGTRTGTQLDLSGMNGGRGSHLFSGVICASGLIAFASR